MKTIATIAAVAMLLLGCQAPMPSPAGLTITGALTLTDYDGIDMGDTNAPGCSGKGGYEDLQEGAQVVVKDGSGGIIATGALGVGQQSAPEPTSLTDCVFPFSVAVPASDFYSIEVTHRGALTFSRAELEAADWTVAFSLG